MEKTLTGTIVLHPVSELPHVQFKRGDELLSALIYFDQLDEAKENIGRTVKFHLMDRPYGPHIISDVGFARIVSMNV
ncbi:hypothetical protein SAMN04488505_104103 [Chitinophaga rupis]|uniref:Uncharacterized protein n=1 Tax=Chitinophaga rupis TaxID=573321 RepID=A0A1H7XLJ7_9BACT|nr:hypothetical protein [Chitinophaga rupis]SEM34057.1 hypothetical protein SAMN04488505_104103 [Chitinophaga rupis]